MIWQSPVRQANLYVKAKTSHKALGFTDEGLFSDCLLLEINNLFLIDLLPARNGVLGKLTLWGQQSQIDALL
ncbi:MAG: hypothetical protein ACI9UN_004090 [Granulosicoccus sp.]|jgi:hypothetical protein